MTRLYLRIFLSFWAVILLTLAITTAVNLSTSRADVDRERAATLRSSLNALAAQAQQVLSSEGSAGLRRWLEEQVAERPQPPLLIVSPDGGELLGRALPEGSPRMLEMLRRLDDGRTERRRLPVRSLRDASGGRYMLFVPSPERGGPRWLAQPESRRNFLVVLFLVSGGLCFLLARYLTRPIRALRLAGARLAAGDLGARVGSAVAGRRDEIGALAREFDRMAERVEELIGSQQRLLRDVSHELRSPLTRLQAAVGLIRQRSGDGADADLDRIEREAERLDGLIGQILSFARLQALAEPLRQPVDLGSLIRDIVTDASFEGLASGKQVRCAADGEHMLAGDEGLLRSAIENVVRNALEHARSQVGVTLAVTGNSWLQVTVTDDGPGVPEGALSQLFEPFYQVPGQVPGQVHGQVHRQVPGGGRAGRGVGLGLAIAARAVELHGGSIRAAVSDAGGLAVELRFRPG